MALQCPACRVNLTADTRTGSRVDRCERCDGVAVTVGLLKRFVPRDRLKSFWFNLPAGSPGRPCPSCAEPMIVAPVECRSRALELDGCRPCQTIWFDADELKAFSPGRQAPEPRAPGRTPEAAEALVKSRAAAGSSREESWFDACAAEVVIEVICEIGLGALD